MRIDLRKFLNLAGLLAAPLCAAPLHACVIADDAGDEETAASMTMTSNTSPGTDGMTEGETMDTTGVDSLGTGTTGVDTEGSGSTGVDTEGGTGSTGVDTEGSGSTGVDTEGGTGTGTGSTGE
jgi:hypothetical protein